jgi:hypothetical protein
MIDDQSEPGSWQEALQWKDQGVNVISVEAVLKERGKRYGEFDQHAQITQNLKSVMHGTRNWVHFLADDHREALEMIAHKIGRILNGDPNYADSWLDIAGYAKLIADRLEKAND